MYEAYFHLQKRPFSATPDPSCLYAPEPIQKVLDELRQAAQSGQGIGVLTAAAGTGKTLLCRRLLVDLERQFTPIFLANANFPTRRELLQAVHFELGRRYSGMEEQELRLELISSLESLALSGRPVVLIVDEAHLLNERLLEELRALASLAEEAQPLLRMLLVGQMDLEIRLIDPSLEALNQRIVCQVYLEPLTRQQSREFVDYRIHWAGGDASHLFDENALDLITQACNGLPRCLNQLCDHSLLLTFVQEAPRVTRAIVEDALADLRQLPLHWNESLGMADELIEGSVADDELGQNDSWEEQVLASEEVDSPHATEAAAAFEIGGDAGTDPAEFFALAASLAANDSAAGTNSTVDTRQPIQPPAGPAVPVVHLPDVLTTGARIFHEELVEDRYAALDLQTPRLARTFEESSTTEVWKPTWQVSVPAPPRPPATPISISGGVGGAAAAPEDIVIDGLPVVESGNDHNAAPTVESPDSHSTAVVQDRDAQLIQQTVSIPPELEEEIGGNILDVCLDVQNSLGEWWEPRSPESLAGASIEGSGFEHRPASPYDIVEPDQPDSPANASVDELLSSLRNPRTTGRYVPKPSYKHMFSLLRRKAGRSLRRTTGEA